MVFEKPEGSATRVPSDLLNVYQSGKYTDIVIYCGPERKVFRAHKVVLCGQSKVFAAMIDGKFKEASTDEIDLPEEDPKVFECLLLFLYSSAFPLSERERLIFYAKLYAAAHRYDISCLAEHVRALFEKVFLGNVVLDPGVFVRFFKSIATIYTSTPETNMGLRRLAVAITVAYVEHIKYYEEQEDNGQLWNARMEAMKDTPAFAFDLCEFTLQEGLPKCKTCPALDVKETIGDVCRNCWRRVLLRFDAYRCRVEGRNRK